MKKKINKKSTLGPKESEITLKIKKMTLENPQMRPCDIAKKLGISPKQIHSVHHRMKVQGLIPDVKKPKDRTQPITIQVKEYLEEYPNANPQEIAKRFNIKRDRVYHIRKAMQMKGKEERLGPTTNKRIDLAVIIEVGRLCEKIGSSKVLYAAKFLSKLGVGK